MRMFEKRLESAMSVGFLGDSVTVSACKFDVSLFSFESMVERLSSDDCDVDDSSDESASVMFSRSLLSQSYVCRGRKEN